MKRILKKFLVVMMISVLLCSSSYTYTYATPWNGLTWDEDLVNVLAVLASGLGIYSSIIHGNASDTIQGLSAWYTMSQYGRNGKTLQEFFEDNYTTNSNSHTVEINAELYNMLVAYLNELQQQTDQQGNPVASQVGFKSLKIEQIKNNDRLFDMSKKFGVTYSYINKLGQTSHYTNGYSLFQSGKSMNFPYLYDGVYYDENLGIYEIECIDATTSNFTHTGNKYYKYQTIKRAMKPRDVDNVYMVGQFNNDNSYKIWMYWYDSENDVLRQIPCYTSHAYALSFEESGSTIYQQNLRPNGSPNDLYLITLTVGNEIFNDTWGLYNPNTMYSNTGLHYGYHVSNGIYMIDDLRADVGGIYKVFDSTSDLLQYVRSGGTTTNNIDNSRNIKKVVITNDNHIEYNYYDDNDPENPSYTPSVTENNIDYTAYLRSIIQKLNEIKTAIDNIDTSGGSGSQQSQTDLNALMAELELIRVAIVNNQTDFTEAWTAQDITNLLNKITALQTNLQTISGYLSSLISAQQTQTNVLTSILGVVRSIDAKIAMKRTIRDTDDNLDWLIDQLTALLENALEIPEELSQMLGTKFPFSIPYVLVAMLHILEAPPETPVFELPLQVEAINLDYTIEIDFEDFQELADVVHFMTLLIWIVGLLKITPAMLSNGSEITDEKGSGL